MNRKPWKSYVISTALAAGSLLAGAISHAEVATVGDFGLIDHQGAQYQLTRLGNYKAVVVMSVSNQCAECVDSLPRYKLLRTTFEKQGVKFLMMDSSTEDNLQSVRAHATSYDIDFPIMMDESQLAAEARRNESRRSVGDRAEFASSSFPRPAGSSRLWRRR